MLPISQEDSSHPWDEGLFEYYGARSMDGTSSLFHKRIFSRLLDNELFDYSSTPPTDGTRSLSPKKDFFIYETTIGRLPRYSILGWDKFPISDKDLVIQELTIRRLLRTQRKYLTTTVLEQFLHFLGRNYSSTRRRTNQLLRHSKKQLKMANDKLRKKVTSRSAVS